jgi:type II secretion system protein J
LLEVLVALALVGTILTMVYGSYAAAARSVDLYSSRLACSDRTCLVLRLLARQLRCLYLPSATLDPASASSPGSTPATTTITLPADLLQADAESLGFVTTAGPDRATALAHVTYRCDPASGTLSLSSEPYVYGGGRLGDSPAGQMLLTGVESLEVQFYDGRQWQSGWTGTGAPALPQGVKITLTVCDDQGRRQEFTTIVAPGCRSAPRLQQVGTGGTPR